MIAKNLQSVTESRTQLQAENWDLRNLERTLKERVTKLDREINEFHRSSTASPPLLSSPLPPSSPLSASHLSYANLFIFIILKIRISKLLVSKQVPMATHSASPKSPGPTLLYLPFLTTRILSFLLFTSLLSLLSFIYFLPFLMFLLTL